MSNTASKNIPDWSSYGFTLPEGTHTLVGSLKMWGRLLASEQCPIGLPIFQRGTAWTEARVELFWDSIARGYPIGTLLLSTAHDVKSRPLPESQYQGATLCNSTEYEALVIDGQQRCVALKLGFREWHKEDTSRLWLDLVSASQFFDSTQSANPFRLCSAVNPWGKLQGRPTISLRQRARALIHHNPFHDRNLELGQTFPLQAQPLPVPLSKLFDLILNGSDVSSKQCIGLVPDGALILSKDDIEATIPLSERQRADLESIAEKRFNWAQLKAFLVNLRVHLTDPLVACFVPQLLRGDDLIEVFVRVNRQAVALSEAELFFSGLKHEWPQANDLVHKIVSDPSLGHVLGATDIVHAAVRLSVSKGREQDGKMADVPRLTVEEFRRLLRKNSSEKLLANLRAQLKIQDDTKRSRLHDLLLKSRKLLSYSGQASDPGLPKPLLTQLRWRIWHVILAWLESSNPKQGVIEKSRFEILRFALLDHFFLGSDATDIIRKPFARARETPPDSVFPGFDIFSDLREDGNPSLLTTEEYKQRVYRDKAPWDILREEGSLLLWAQREWLDEWFHDFDPAAPNVADDLPYDIDHIMPKNCLDGRSVWNHIAPEIADDFGQNKDALRESIGNKRVWPREANRGDQDESPKDKLFLDKNRQENVPDYLVAWQLVTVGQVWKASLIQESEVEGWRKASGLSKWDWTDPDRFKMFREVVNARRVRLYETFFRELGYVRWLHNEEISRSDDN